MAQYIYTVRDFIESLRAGKFTSVGSYPKFWITRHNDVLSYEACCEHALEIGRAINGKHPNDCMLVVACDVNWEDPDLYCEETGNRIESAYAEPEETE